MVRFLFKLSAVKFVKGVITYRPDVAGCIRFNSLYRIVVLFLGQLVSIKTIAVKTRNAVIGAHPDTLFLVAFYNADIILWQAIPLVVIKEVCTIENGKPAKSGYQ